MEKTKEQLAEEARRNLGEYTGGWEETFDKGFLSGYEVAQPKWVSVYDETPVLHRGVLLQKSGSPMFVGYLDETAEGRSWYDMDDVKVDEDFVTHWMYLPARPQGEE